MAEALRFESVGFRYPQDGCGAPPVSLELDEGEALLLSGNSGSGKSTLARLACGIIPHLYHGELSGRSFLFAKPTAGLPLWQISELAGMVFQNPAAQMLTTSVEDELIFGLENLGLPRQAVSERLEAALEQFGLAALRHRRPQTLSGGEQQKLALACMLARRTPLLVLDEPLSMLDSSAARELVWHLGELKNQGRSLLICEHRQALLADLAGLRKLNLPTADQPPAGVQETDPPRFWPANNPPAPFALEAAGLEIQRGGRTVLAGVNFSLAGGQVALILGRNGAGKTSLLRALAGLQKFEGSLRVQSQAGAVKPQFAMVFQNPDVQLFQASVQAEILFNIPNPDLGWYAWLLKILELERYEHKPPLLLSEGEKRRVLLATALMNRPAHGILLDEPSLGQDPHHKAILLRLISALAQAGYLVLVASHDLELAARADQLLLLHAQGLLAQDSPACLFANPAVWAQMGLWLPFQKEAVC